MALQKTPVSINFSQGLDTKSDPFQVPVGQFLSLKNSIFNTNGRLTKRNGFKNLTTLPNANQTTITTLNGNLIATGSNLLALSTSTNEWLDQGSVQPVDLTVKPLVRTSTSQSSPDSVISSNGLNCLVYMDDGLGYYQITDVTTGQQIVNRTALPDDAINPRVFLLGVYFVITFVADILGTPTLQFVAIPTAMPTNPQAADNISASLASQTTGYDGYVAGNKLFLAWGGNSSAVKIAYLSNSLAVSTVTNISSAVGDLVSVTAEEDLNRLWVTYYDTALGDAYVNSYTLGLGPIVTATQILNNVAVSEITTLSQDGILNVYYQVANTYAYAPNASSAYISTLTVTPPVGVGTGTVSSPLEVIRSVGLASKPFVTDTNDIYMLVAYGDINQSPSQITNQATYFLIDDTGNIYMRLASTNGGGYAASQVLPQVSLFEDYYHAPYMFADFLTTVNKGTDLPPGSPVNAIYTQYGINDAKFGINLKNQQTSEIAGALHLTGGQLWEYDGVLPVEHGFHVYPENVSVTTATTGGNVDDGTYYYVFTYEWTDAAGNLHRSAPSIPVSIVTTGGDVSTNTIYVPTLRLTAKETSNPVRIVGYRWSVAQQVYYQFTSVTNPVLNDKTNDSVTITDTLSDAAILGQTILYTTGGVIENIAAPASKDSCLFDNRLVLINAEDPNTLLFSKQVIQNTPVEMSDLLTIYVAPTTGAQGSTGPAECVSAMDDKLIVFKQDAIYYINGNGPDNTGSNNTYSQPVFITGTVGCANPDSVVLTPNGIMFQSDKGIWLLGRDLNTNYIGAPVEAYNEDVVLSATAIPGTNEVRFILASGVTLMYDYFYQQWSVHTNIKAVSATIYEGKHTYINSSGLVFQENPGSYIDGAEPVLLSLTTSWINIAGIQGYERFYEGYLLGSYYSPFKLDVQLAYNYNPSATQSIKILPDNYAKNYGREALWGSGPTWGGPGNVFETRFFPITQKCESFQVTIQEVYDASLGAAPGQGLSLSGINLIVGAKRGFRTQKAGQSFG